MSETNGRLPLLEAVDLRKDYWLPEKGRIEVLRGVDLRLHEGEVVALLGKSGAGKSTLLHLLGTLDAPTSGEIRFEGEPLSTKDEVELADFRNRTIGFVFQSHYLLPDFTALENAMMPLLVRRMERRRAEQEAAAMLERVGLGDRLEHRPGELSGGEQQRVALARALATRPRILLADEPTGNLDPKTGRALLAHNRARGITALAVTHNETMARDFPRRLRMEEGRVVAGD